MPALLDHIHPRQRNRRREEFGLEASGNERRESGGENQCKRIHRPDSGVIVIVGVDQLGPVMVFVMRRDVVEMRVDGGRMVVIGASGVNVLEGRDKECQQ